ncbi:hypothetical protein MRB53_030640 [Persea americana]|uniref:Uncharacterized protein n=1 Tax=Persea americana TaxID=3435 RepID=A0ACC2KLW1_PERAE|nr:hypothetical protein MRB53_030640 [Persea americana]
MHLSANYHAIQTFCPIHQKSCQEKEIDSAVYGLTAVLGLFSSLKDSLREWFELLDSNNFQSEDGDIIDCVDIYKQPALDNPLLKNHTIQMIPNYVKGKTKESSSQFLQIQLLWKKCGTCPEGTVPIRRMLEGDLLRSIPTQYPMVYHKKDPRSLVEFAYASIDWDWNKDQGPYESASVSINVWNVHVA